MYMINNQRGAVFIYYINGLQRGLDHAVVHICNLKGADKEAMHVDLRQDFASVFVFQIACVKCAFV